MIFKSTIELRFQRSREPMPTVEIDLDSLPSHAGYGQLVQDTLSELARRMPDLLATVYVRECVSVNFGDQGYSAFFGVLGPARVREALYAGFKSVPGIKLRHSDHITSAEALCQFHIEEGMLWFPYEAHKWCADEIPAAKAPALNVDGSKQDDAGSHSGDDDDRPHEDESESSGPIPSRYRAARADASIDTIRRTIESVFGLPAGSVALRGPDKKNLRGDATVGTLRRRWE